MPEAPTQKYHQAVGERFRLIRRSLNQSQKEIAVILNTGQGAISAIELGNQALSIEMLNILAREYRISTSYLVAGEGPMYTTPDSESYRIVPLQRIREFAEQGALAKDIEVLYPLYREVFDELIRAQDSLRAAREEVLVLKGQGKQPLS